MAVVVFPVYNYNCNNSEYLSTPIIINYFGLIQILMLMSCCLVMAINSVYVSYVPAQNSMFDASNSNRSIQKPPITHIHTHTHTHIHTYTHTKSTFIIHQIHIRVVVLVLVYYYYIVYSLEYDCQYYYYCYLYCSQ